MDYTKQLIANLKAVKFRQHTKDEDYEREQRFIAEDSKLRLAITDELMYNKILDVLGDDGPQRVVLAGESGIGKTRLAKLVEEHATSRKLCFLTIWLHLNNKFDDQLSLYENIAFQIGAYDRNAKEEEKDPQVVLTGLKDKIIAELKRKRHVAREKILAKERVRHTYRFGEREKEPTSSPVTVPLYLLLILDDEGNKTSEDKVLKDFGLESFLIDNLPLEDLKLLITTRNGGDGNATKSNEETESYVMDESHDSVEIEDADIEPDDTKSIDEIESNPEDTRSEDQIESHTTFETDTVTKSQGKNGFHTTDLSRILLDSINESHLSDLFETLIKSETRHFLKSLQRDWKVGASNCRAFSQVPPIVVQENSRLPAAVVVLAKSLNCIPRCLSPKQEKLLKQILSPCDPAYSSVSGYNRILQLAYQLLETDGTLQNAIVICFWHSLDYFKLYGCIHYDELITQWILEGYFDPVRSVRKAYDDGHAILVELINRGFFNIQEGDMVVPESAMVNLIDHRHHELLRRSRLRFARVYGGHKNNGLGKITRTDDMIRTVQATKGNNISTLLIGGNRLRRETPKEFFEKLRMKDLEVVVLFDPAFKYLNQSLRELKQLRVLVIRDYDLLSSMEELKGLRELEVLEVSGASSVETISDDFFEAAFKLQSLNLSGLGIKSLPSSISRLKHLHSIILRDCSSLEDLPDIQHLDNLEVVDVRGAKNLRTCFEENTSKNRTFARLQRLVLLDFSESKLKRLPIFSDPEVAAEPHALTWLSLHNCCKLVKLPNLKPLSNLQTLDLSGTTSLVEISAVCFEKKDELKILNLSGTKLNKLPSTISGLSKLRQLLMRDISNLEALPNINGLTSLEVLDVSGCGKLNKIEGSFKDMSSLQEVYLCGTRIETLPELPEKSSIYCSKMVVLADSRRFIHDMWSQVKEAITAVMSENLSSSETVDRIQEISINKSGRVCERWGFDCPERKEHFGRGDIYKDVYMNTIPFVDTNNFQEVLEIRGSNEVDQDKDALAKAEFVAVVDNDAARFASIYNNLKSVKGCWLEMCRDTEIIFSGVDKERLGNLETLSITNVPRLESIHSSSFKNLKKLSLDCCPSIKTLFPASALPTTLEVLKIKFCEKLEEVFEKEVELTNLHTLCLFNLPVLSAINATLPNLKTYTKDKCPKLETSKEDLCGKELETA